MTDPQAKTAADLAIDDALKGKVGRLEPKHGDPTYLNAHERNVLRRLANTCGVSPRFAPYVIKRFRYHMGKGMTPTPPKGINGTELDYVHRRVWEELDGARGLLPPLRDSTEPRA